MAKIMEPNVAQSVLFEQESVVLCHIIRSEELTELVGADEVIVLSVVAAFEHLTVSIGLYSVSREILDSDEFLCGHTAFLHALSLLSAGLKCLPISSFDHSKYC